MIKKIYLIKKVEKIMILFNDIIHFRFIASWSTRSKTFLKLVEDVDL